MIEFSDMNNEQLIINAILIIMKSIETEVVSAQSHAGLGKFPLYNQNYRLCLELEKRLKND